MKQNVYSSQWLPSSHTTMVLTPWLVYFIVLKKNLPASMVLKVPGILTTAFHV